ERYTLSLLDEDDKAPIGVYANFESDQITIYLSIASLNGTKLLITSATGNDYKVVAKKVADELIAQGALDIIENSKRGKESMHLTNKHVLVTREATQATEFNQMIENNSGKVLSAPL